MAKTIANTGKIAIGPPNDPQNTDRLYNKKDRPKAIQSRQQADRKVSCRTTPLSATLLRCLIFSDRSTHLTELVTAFFTFCVGDHHRWYKTVFNALFSGFTTVMCLVGVIVPVHITATDTNVCRDHRLRTVFVPHVSLLRF